MPAKTTSHTAIEAINILLDSTYDERTDIPYRVERNESFLIRLSEGMTLGDLAADGNGVYKNQGHKIDQYEILGGTVMRSKEKANQISKKNEVYLHRRYWTHKGHPDFHRRWFYLSKDDEPLNDLVLVQYLFDRGEHKISVMQHGNSKKKKKFSRTQPSVMHDLQSKLESLPPKQALHNVAQSRGGILRAKNDSELPRNRNQAYYIKKQHRICGPGSKIGHFEKDEMFQVLVAAKNEQKDFVQHMVSHPEPLIICALESQLDGVAQSCTSEMDFSVLSIDPTFNNGPFNVIPTTFRHKMLYKTGTQESPVFLGPVAIAPQKKESTYSLMFSALGEVDEKIKNILAIGTDGEPAIMAAAEVHLKKATFLRCHNHVKQNLKAFTNKEKIPVQPYMKDIFGYRSSDGIFVGGLLSVTNESEFKGTFSSLKLKWEKLNGSTQIIKWVTDRSSMMINHMIAGVLTKCGLGYPPLPFTNNDVEGMNKHIKEQARHKQSGELTFIQNIRQMAKQQEAEFMRALVRESDLYEVRPQFEHMVIEPDEWYGMTESQRRKQSEKIMKMTMEQLYSSSSQSGIFSVHQPSVNDAFEVSPCEFGMAKEHGEATWKKAEDLIKTKMVMEAQITNSSVSNAFCVKSESGPPHYVTIYAQGKVVCPCRQYRAENLCSHAVAAAQESNKLHIYLQWYKTITPNITSVAMHGIDISKAGRKGGKPKRKRTRNTPILEVKQLYMYINLLHTYTYL